MAEKIALVRLRAVTDQYEAAMRRAKKATSEVADPRGFQRLGSQMRDIGGNLTRYVSLPLAGVGVAAGKLSLDFEAAFSKMQGLAGVSASEVDGLRKAVQELAVETGKGPQELADALYFIRSAGISGSAALETLEMAAKGAAAGLGSTVAVANAVTNAIGAYGEANITAAEATDVLVQTARLGKAEAADLAPQFGRILPVARELGVSFDEIGAGLAFLSRTTGDAALSSTYLQNVLQKLLVPTDEGQAALAAIGMSADDLRKSLKERGLLRTLVDLRSTLERNGLSLQDFSRDQQFTVGALALTAEGGKAAAEVFGDMEDRVGATEEAFAKFAETAGFKNKQAFANLQVALIELGDVLVPIAADILEFVAKFAKAFSDLPEPVQKAAIALGLLAVATGPLLSAGGNLLRIWNASTTAAMKYTTAGTNLAHVFGTVETQSRYTTVATGGMARGFLNAAKQAAGLAATLIALQYVTDNMGSQFEEARDSLTKEFLEALQKDGGEVGKFTQQLVDSKFAAAGYADDIEKAGVSHKTLMSAIGGSKAALDVIQAAVRKTGGDVSGVTFEILSLSGGLVTAKSDFDEFSSVADTAGADIAGLGSDAAGATGDIEGFGDGLDETSEAAEAVDRSIELLREEIEKLLRPLDTQSALDSFNSGLNDMEQGFRDADERVAQLREDLEDLRSDKVDRATRATEDLAAAQRDLEEARGVKDPEDRARRIADAEARIASIRRDAARDQAALDEQIIEKQGEIDDAIAETSRTLDGNTDAAIRNRDKLIEMVRKAAEAIQSAREDGEHSREELEAIKDSQVASLREVAERLGLNEEEVASYIAKIEAIPLTVETTVELNILSAQEALDRFLAGLEAVYKVGGAEALARLQRDLAKNETGVPTRALGGSALAGMLYEVNEGGNTESFLLPNHTGTVLSHTATMAMAGATTSQSQTNNYQVTVAAPVTEPGERTMFRELRALAWVAN